MSALTPSVLAHAGIGYAPAPEGADLLYARLTTRLGLDGLGRWTGRHRTTLRRMELGRSRVDLATYHLALVLAGVIIAPGWIGWCFGPDGRLYAPEDPFHGFSPGDLRRFAWAPIALSSAECRRNARHPGERLPV